MYAVFRTGGKQYRASKGEVLKLEKLDADEGAKVQFDEVLLVGEGKDIKVGSPLLAGSSVSAKVLKQGKSKKVSVVTSVLHGSGDHRYFRWWQGSTEESCGKAR
jgi:large subunit ribosomal protein L21